MQYRRIKGRAGRVNAHEIQEWVKWLLEEQCGCCHKVVAYTENNEVSICVGWRYDDDEWYIYGKVGFQSKNNVMQIDMDIDFLMPWNTKAYCDKMNAQLTEEDKKCKSHYVVGDVYDTSVFIYAKNDRVPDLHPCKCIADELNSYVTGVARLVCGLEATGDA